LRAGSLDSSARASFVVTTAAGTTTFTGVYRTQGASGTCTIAAGHSIIVQVYQRELVIAAWLASIASRADSRWSARAYRCA
jgi:hypothetical protein